MELVFIMSIVKLVVEERPLMFLGLPGAVCLALGAVFGVWLLQLYSTIHQIVTNVALGSLGLIIIGFFLMSTAIMLYALNRVAEKVSH